MIVKELELSNFKTIESFKGSFEGNVYLVTGENELGKSTLIDAIGTLLTGDRSNNLLKRGTEKGFAKMTVGEGEDAYEVELKFSDKNPRGTLTIGRLGDGLKSNNKSALESIFKYEDFDPDQFLRWSETAEGRRKQAEAVKKLFPVEIQNKINELDYQVAQAKDKRTEIGREIKTIQGQFKMLFMTPEEIAEYEKPVDVVELSEKQSKASELNEKRSGVIERIEERKAKIQKTPSEIDVNNQKTEQKIAENLQKIEALKKENEELRASNIEKNKAIEAEVSEMEKKNKEGEKWLKKNPVQDVESIKKEIQTASEHNKKSNQVQEFKRVSREMESLANRHSSKEQEISKATEEKKALIESAKLPVSGLDFDEEGLTLNGFPFNEDSVSTSQAMEVAISLIIAKNPKTKVFRVARGESLGTAKMKAIIDFANKNGYQGFIEEVARGQNELVVYKYGEKL